MVFRPSRKISHGMDGRMCWPPPCTLAWLLRIPCAYTRGHFVWPASLWIWWAASCVHLGVPVEDAFPNQGARCLPRWTAEKRGPFPTCQTHVSTAVSRNPLAQGFWHLCEKNIQRHDFSFVATSSCLYPPWSMKRHAPCSPSPGSGSRSRVGAPPCQRLKCLRSKAVTENGWVRAMGR